MGEEVQDEGSAAVRGRREDEADAREEAADRREQASDIREGVLDRWERELTARAVELNVLDKEEEASLEAARRRRADEHRRRRAEAEERNDAAIRRGIERTTPARGSDDIAVLHVMRSGALERLAAIVDGSTAVAETLDAILDIATDAVPDAAAATIALVVGGQLEPAASTSDWAGELDASQVRAGTGPLVDAVTSATIVESANLADDDRWRFPEPIGAEARRGVLVAPIAVGAESGGALTIYAARGRQLDEQAGLVAAMLAAQASIAVGWSLARLTHRAQTEAWERALASRDQIGQAKGILMAQHDLTADAAFELLRSTSQNENVKVRDIAEHVITHGRLPGVDRGHAG